MTKTEAVNRIKNAGKSEKVGNCDNKKLFIREMFNDMPKTMTEQKRY